MLRLGRWSWFVRRMQRRAEHNLVAIAQRSVGDAEELARARRDPQVWPLFSTMLLRTFERMDERLAGTRNDIEISRTATFPLEELRVPVLTVHGTADRVVAYDVHAQEFAARVPNVEAVTIDGGEHVALFTHRAVVRSRVAAFLASLA